MLYPPVKYFGGSCFKKAYNTRVYVYIQIYLPDELSHQNVQGLVECSLRDNVCCAPGHLEALKSVCSAIRSGTIRHQSQPQPLGDAVTQTPRERDLDFQMLLLILGYWL